MAWVIKDAAANNPARGPGGAPMTNIAQKRWFVYGNETQEMPNLRV